MTHLVLHADCREGMAALDDHSVDLSITSPPYKAIDGYTEELMISAFANVFRVLKANSLFFLNFGHLAEDKFRPFRVCELAKTVGFRLNETFTWVKNHYRPIQGRKRVNNLTEFVFLLYKGKMPNLDRLAVGVPYADKSNVGRFSDVDLRCGGNIWYIPYETIQRREQKDHNDRFPIGLPVRCMLLSGLKTGTVLDPFMGSGTTAVAAQSQQLSSIGYEINRKVYTSAKARIEF